MVSLGAPVFGNQPPGHEEAQTSPSRETTCMERPTWRGTRGHQPPANIDLQTWGWWACRWRLCPWPSQLYAAKFWYNFLRSHSNWNISYHFNQQRENPDSEDSEHDCLRILYTMVTDTGCRNQGQDSLDGETEAQSPTSLGSHSEGESVSAFRPNSSDNHLVEVPLHNNEKTHMKNEKRTLF